MNCDNVPPGHLKHNDRANTVLWFQAGEILYTENLIEFA